MIISYSTQALGTLADAGNKDAKKHLSDVNEMNKLQMELLIWAGPQEAGTEEFKGWVQEHYVAADQAGMSRIDALRGMIDEIRSTTTINPLQESK